MSLMDRIISEAQVLPRRCLVYGVQGVGKSTFAAEFPSPIFLPTEDGARYLPVAKFPLMTSYAEVMQAIGELYTSEHGYQTAVIDSLDWLEPLIWAEITRVHKVASIEDVGGGFNKGKSTYAPEVWREVLAGLDALRNERGMHIVLLAHAKVEAFKDPDTDTYDRYSPKLDKHSNGAVLEWCDDVLFATYRTLTKSSDEGFKKTRHRAIGNSDRVLRTTHRPAHIAKNRLGLPDELPLVKGEGWLAYSYHFTAPTGATTPSEQKQ